VKLDELTRVISELLTPPNEAKSGDDFSAGDPVSGGPTIFIVDDDPHVRDIIKSVFEDDGYNVSDYETCEAFLEAYYPAKAGCLLVDAYLPGMSGLELLKTLQKQGWHIPAVLMTGDSDISIAVEAMRAGAVDFIEKPVARTELLLVIARALEHAQDASKELRWHAAAAEHIAGLTDRQREIMRMVLAGSPSKNIAVDLGISQRTVENHRASIMRKTGCKSLPALARLAVAAS
jgi:two-component system CheB/CheR fusion protein